MEYGISPNVSCSAAITCSSRYHRAQEQSTNVIFASWIRQKRVRHKQIYLPSQLLQAMHKLSCIFLQAFTDDHACRSQYEPVSNEVPAGYPYKTDFAAVLNNVPAVNGPECRRSVLAHPLADPGVFTVKRKAAQCLKKSREKCLLNITAHICSAEGTG